MLSIEFSLKSIISMFGFLKSGNSRCLISFPLRYNQARSLSSAKQDGSVLSRFVFKLRVTKLGGKVFS